MADTRVLHKRGSHGERIKALSHLEFRVWVQYVLSADDFGVMRASASVVRADNPTLEREPLRKIDAALSAIRASGLTSDFTDQGERYYWQLNWQDYQDVRHPRKTPLPRPSAEVLLNASEATQGLFRKHPRSLPQDSGKVSESLPSLAGAGGRETHTQTQTLDPGSGSLGESAREPELVVNQGGTYTPVNPHSKPTNLINAGEQRAHGLHGWCDFTRGLCVPFGMHTEFRQRLGGEDAERRLRAWYPTVVARYADQPIGDGVFEFWRNEFAAWVGTVTQRQGTSTARTTRTLSAAQRVIEGQLATEGAKR